MAELADPSVPEKRRQTRLHCLLNFLFTADDALSTTRTGTDARAALTALQRLEEERRQRAQKAEQREKERKEGQTRSSTLSASTSEWEKVSGSVAASVTAESHSPSPVDVRDLVSGEGQGGHSKEFLEVRCFMTV